MEIDISFTHAFGVVLRCRSGVRYMNGTSGAGQGIEGSIEGTWIPLSADAAVFSNLRNAWNGKGPEGLVTLDDDVAARLSVVMRKHFDEGLTLDASRRDEAFFGWVPVLVRSNAHLLISGNYEGQGVLAWGGHS
jgi:hypothetical protein